MGSKETRMIESNFGINWQALAVLANLQSRDGLECSWNGERYKARVESAPWYNCRERGVVFYLKHLKSGRQVNVAVFEHRVGDHLCAAEWESDFTLNPPGLADLPEDTFNGGNWTCRWDHGQVSDAAEWVYSRLERFWTGCEKAAA